VYIRIYISCQIYIDICSTGSLFATPTELDILLYRTPNELDINSVFHQHNKHPI